MADAKFPHTVDNVIGTVDTCVIQYNEVMRRQKGCQSLQECDEVHVIDSLLARVLHIGTEQTRTRHTEYDAVALPIQVMLVDFDLLSCANITIAATKVTSINMCFV